MLKIATLINLSKPLVLASQSPRRKKLLADLGFDFEIQVPDVDENIDTSLEPCVYVQKLAMSKAKIIALRQNSEKIIIGADTIVVLNGEILNKPLDEDDAFNMLKKLSDAEHTVYTGIAIYESVTNRFKSHYQQTNVRFRKLYDDEIKMYIQSGSPMDKAGSYGIQDDFGAVFVSEIHGCYYNIVGLPVELLYQKLREFCNEN